MRGMGDFQRAQMKHRDARVSAMAQHLRGLGVVPGQIRTEEGLLAAEAMVSPPQMIT